MDLREWNLVASGDFSRRHPWEIARLWSVCHLLEQNGFSAEDSFTALDFGSGDLFVAAGLCGRFPRARVVSVDSAYTEDTSKALLQGVHTASVKCFSSLEGWRLSVEEAPAEVVLLLDVLEHCQDDSAVLASILDSNKVAKGALWLVTVPAHGFLFTRYDTFLGHYRRYAYSQLVRTVRAAGILPSQGGYFFLSLLLPRFLQKVAEVLGLGAKSPKGLAGFRPPSRVGKFIATLLYWDYRFCTFWNRLGVRMPGLSCYVLARQK